MPGALPIGRAGESTPPNAAAAPSSVGRLCQDAGDGHPSPPVAHRGAAASPRESRRREVARLQVLLSCSEGRGGCARAAVWSAARAAAGAGGAAHVGAVLATRRSRSRSRSRGRGRSGGATSASGTEWRRPSGSARRSARPACACAPSSASVPAWGATACCGTAWSSRWRSRAARAAARRSACCRQCGRYGEPRLRPMERAEGDPLELQSPPRSIVSPHDRRNTEAAAGCGAREVPT